ncbi:MAG: glycosyltransferase family 4 protein, partial [Gaiellaceae bacterium]
MASPAFDSPPGEAHRTLPALWLAPLLDPSGYSDEARNFLLALERGGYATCARNWRQTGTSGGVSGVVRETIDRALARDVPEGEFTFVRHMVPTAFAHPSPDRGPQVMRTMYETDRIPNYWRAALLDVDEIWVPCEHNIDSFQRAGIPAERLRLLPGTIDFDLFDPGAVEPWPMPQARRFTFLTNFDFTDRKGWSLLLDAWADAFEPTDDVSLVLKCVSMHGSADDIGARIQAHLGGRATAPLILNTNVVPMAEMPRLYAAADAYVLASRGEGWGRPYMEAMAMGLPTIGSRWSGNLAFMNDDNSWLLDGKVVPIERWDPLPERMWKGHRWFEPDHDSLVQTM